MDESQLLSLNVSNLALYNTVRYQTYPGPQGKEGPSGAAGPTGAPGVNGTASYTGATGQPGYATNTGSTGSSGPPGANGINGTPGYTGVTGQPGYATNTGSTGSSGPPGANGANGAIGATGPQGIPGGPTGYRGPTGDPGPAGSGGSGGNHGVLKIPSSTTNFNFTTAVSTLPSSFATYNPGSLTDGTTFTLTLNSSYGPGNLPFYNVTGYVYSATAGYINCQRQLGAQSGVAAAYITMNASVTTITFNYINKTNFPYTTNDSSGYALYICFNILN